jgi:hypothetical protein
MYTAANPSVTHLVSPVMAEASRCCALPVAIPARQGAGPPSHGLGFQRVSGVMHRIYDPTRYHCSSKE